jgi:hypothetical protein
MLGLAFSPNLLNEALIDLFIQFNQTAITLNYDVGNSDYDSIQFVSYDLSNNSIFLNTTYYTAVDGSIIPVMFFNWSNYAIEINGTFLNETTNSTSNYTFLCVAANYTSAFFNFT